MKCSCFLTNLEMGWGGVDLKGNLNKLNAPKANHLFKMLSLSRVPNKAQKEVAPIQNRPVCTQQSAEGAQCQVWLCHCLPCGGEGDGDGLCGQWRLASESKKVREPWCQTLPTWVPWEGECYRNVEWERPLLRKTKSKQTKNKEKWMLADLTRLLKASLPKGNNNQGQKTLKDKSVRNRIPKSCLGISCSPSDFFT